MRPSHARSPSRASRCRPWRRLQPPSVPIAGPVTKKTALEIQALTLSDFHAYARDQADWHGELVKTDKKGANELRSLLEFAESGKTQPVLSACAQMTVASLLAAKVTTTNRQALLTYSLANAGDSKSVEVGKSPGRRDRDLVGSGARKAREGPHGGGGARKRQAARSTSSNCKP